MKKPKIVHLDKAPEIISLLWAANNLNEEEFSKFIEKIKKTCKIPRKVK